MRIRVGGSSLILNTNTASTILCPASQTSSESLILDESLEVCQIYNTQPLKVSIHNFIRDIFRAIGFVCAISSFFAGDQRSISVRRKQISDRYKRVGGEHKMISIRSSA